MRVRRNVRLEKLFIDTLCESMTVHLMERLVRRIIANYDLHQRSGFPENIPIPQVNAAQQVYMDMMAENLLPRFIEVLIDVDTNGYMGRPVHVRLLPQVLDALQELGLYYDERYGAIVESEHKVKTGGWGVLREGFTYELSFLSFDIVGSSEIVRKHTHEEIVHAYTNVKRVAAGLIEKREGRIWRWEGDGALAAFYFGNRNFHVAMAGIEILLELFMYNLFDCPLKEPIGVRLGAHTGPCSFNQNVDEIQSATLNRLAEIDYRYTEPDSLTISPGVYSDLGTKLERFFRPHEVSSRNYLYRYKLRWE